ncbi:Major Facilitator Superfamily protein [Lutibacter oricola]|uniref:Major Facilitator Superfamily protein n=1 Tax=Lutibacter oricola TaxID=762486 RepID=A0A1H2XI51_9FLAO|nr:MFS transporter [Lutibacter oricola]SDW92541.1 Major Facilitator Superfamily protein [Lutibacter oricola]
MTNKFEIVKPKKVPFFYGYVVLFFGTIGIWASIPGQTVGVSVFTDYVKDALGLTRNEFSNAYMIGTFLSSFIVAKAGFWFDKFGARYVAFFATIVLGFSLLLCSISVEISEFVKSFLNNTSWLIPFCVITILFFFIRLSGQGILTMASRNMVMMWFDKHRGKVNSLSSIAISLGFSSSPIFISKLIDNNGWELSWQLMAISLFIFSLFILIFYKNKPEDYNLNPDGEEVKSVKENKPTVTTNFTLKEAKKTRAFWVYGLILSFNSFFITGFTFHVISIFKSFSYTKTQAISIFLPISIIAVSVATLCNVLSDYIQHKIYLYIMLFCGCIASLGLLFLNYEIGVYLLIIGLGVLGGLFSVVNAVTWPKYYGRKYLGSITGKIMSFLVLASAIAPTLFSYSFTYFGSYSYVSILLLTFVVGLIIASLKVENPQNNAVK